MAEARGPAPHRRPQAQQLPRPAPAHPQDGQAAGDRRDRRRPARRGHGHRGRPPRPGVRRLHGRGGHPPPAPQRRAHAAARHRGAAGGHRHRHPQGRHQRGAAGLGRVGRLHPLRHRVGGRPHPFPSWSGSSSGSSATRPGPRSWPPRPPARPGRGLRRRRVERGQAVRRLRRRRRVRLVGVEAGGRGPRPGDHGASLGLGEAGVLHGARSYVLQDPDGQVLPTHSVSAGLDYPGVGPEHAFWKDAGRVAYGRPPTPSPSTASASSPAPRAAPPPWSRPTPSAGSPRPRLTAGSPPAPWSSSTSRVAVTRTSRPSPPCSAPTRPRGFGRARRRSSTDQGNEGCLSRVVPGTRSRTGSRGRAPTRPAAAGPPEGRSRAGSELRSAVHSPRRRRARPARPSGTGCDQGRASGAGGAAGGAAGRAAGRASGAGRHGVAGYPDLDGSLAAFRTMAEARPAMLEIGPPYSDPLIDGPVIQRAVTAALDAGTRLDDVLGLVNELTASVDAPVVLLVYYNLVAHAAPSSSRPSWPPPNLRGGRSRPAARGGGGVAGGGRRRRSPRVPGRPDIQRRPPGRGRRGRAGLRLRPGVAGRDRPAGVTRRRDRAAGRPGRAHTDLPVCAGIGVSTPTRRPPSPASPTAPSSAPHWSAASATPAPRPPRLHRRARRRRPPPAADAVPLPGRVATSSRSSTRRRASSGTQRGRGRRLCGGVRARRGAGRG